MSALTGLVGRPSACKHVMRGFESQHDHFIVCEKARRFLTSKTGLAHGEGSGPEMIAEIETSSQSIVFAVYIAYVACIVT